MSEITIRPALATDAAALTNVILAAYAPYRRRIPDLPDVSGGLANDIANHNVWVAEIGGQIVGGIVLVQHQDIFHLANIAVSPDQHGRGIGRILIETAEAYAEANGGIKMRLATHVDMPDNVSVYQRLGWQETGREGNKVLMVKNIGSSKNA